MGIREQIQRFEDLIDFVESELPRYAEQVLASDIIALVTNRVVQRGENYLGSKFTPYSNKTVAAWRFWGKSRNQAAERRVRALSRARGALTYTEFRKLNNLNSDNKNFEFTGEMWRKFGIVKRSNLGQKFVISIGGTTPSAQTKIDENSAREGMSIIEASDKEASIAQQGAQEWLNDNAERILNE